MPQDAGEREFARPSLLAVMAMITGMVSCRAVGLCSVAATAVAMLIVVVAGVVLRRREHLRVHILLVLFVCGGFLLQAPINRNTRDSLRVIEALETAPAGLIRVRGSLTGEIRLHERGATVWLAPGSVASAPGAGEYRLPSPLPIYLPGTPDEFHDLARGDALSAHCKLRPLAQFTIARNADQWLEAQGAAASAMAVQWNCEPGARSAASRVALAMRHTGDWMQQTLLREVGPREGGVLCAMMLGRTNGLDDAQRAAYMRTGLMHIFSVSGLHAGLIGGMLAGCAALLRLGPRRRAVLVVFGLILFCLLTGMRSSALRAALLVTIFFAQPLVKRSVDPLGALASVANFLLVVRPRALWQVDFQLSFLCALTLVLCSPGSVKIEEYLGRRLPNSWKWYWAPMISALQIGFITLCLQLALAPIVATSLGTISLVSPIANILLLPAIGILMGCGFAALAVHAIFPPFAEPLFWGLEIAVNLMQWLTDLLAAVPGAAIENTRPWPVWISALYMLWLLSGGWLRLRAVFSELDGVYPAFTRAVGAVAFIIWTPMFQSSRDALTMTFLDVGQGDATLVQTRAGCTMLVDAGPPAAGDDIVRELQTRGIERLDLLILTHADADHIGGAAEVVERMRPGQLIVGGGIAATETWEQLAATVDFRDIPVATASRGATISLADDVVASVLHPGSEFTGGGGDRNEGSVVLKINVGEVSFLLTGDAEETAESIMLTELDPADIRCTVLKAGHHGSASSTSAAFLDAARPDAALVSCGRNNRYGHPAPVVLNKLNAAGAEIWRTDQNGTIEMRTDGRRLWIRSERR